MLPYYGKKEKYEGESIRRTQSDDISYQTDFQKHVLMKGRKILEENQFFQKIESLMKDEKFRSFYDEYFKSSIDIQTVILYLKLYETLEYEYESKYQQPIPKELMAYTIQSIFTDKKMRGYTMESFQQFTDNIELSKKNGHLLPIFDKIKKITF